ncbi:hypothetical protein KC614_05140 [candidate division WWE3 bacterium]|uniref:Uncharacterized protein n=1 Tax=candidate division WWE3 bacterium TaxID=2053526 RepID=A0A955LL71_UNCKA|nr:hypothetical protein [candidate division WWE3 bacterium]
MDDKVATTLLQVLKLIEINSNIDVGDEYVIPYKERNLMKVTKDEISVLGVNLDDKFTIDKPRLPDHTKNMSMVETFIKNVSKGFLRINHIGFAYRVMDKDAEYELVVRDLHEAGIDVYVEASNDPMSKWIFAGDIGNWENTIIEIVPADKKRGEWMNYWLPQIHIDIDTDLSAEHISSRVNEIFSGTPVKPFNAVEIDGVVYVVGLFVAIANGVNIYLNLGTDQRVTKVHRYKRLERVV